MKIPFKLFIPLFLTLVIFLSNAVNAENKIKLIESDFYVSGLSFGMNSKNIKKILGSPKKISFYNDHREPGLKFSVWEYDGLRITVEDDKIINGITIISKLFSTNRGLTVGSSKEKLIDSYGNPNDTYKSGWDYYYVDDLTVMRITLNNNKVESIYLGGIND